MHTIQKRNQKLENLTLLHNKDHKVQSLPSNRNFGFTFASFFLFLAVLKFHGDNISAAKYLLVCSGAFAIITVCLPKILFPLNKQWSKLGYVLHKIMTPVVMGLMFYVVITPIAVIMRCSKWDPLRLRYDFTAKSYWLQKDTMEQAVGSMKNQF